MNVGGVPYRTIWLAQNGQTVEIIDQTRLPHAFVTVPLRTCDDAVHAIRSMQVRGAPLIGATAAYGLCLALAADSSDEALATATESLLASRPTAVKPALGAGAHGRGPGRDRPQRPGRGGL